MERAECEPPPFSTDAAVAGQEPDPVDGYVEEIGGDLSEHGFMALSRGLGSADQLDAAIGLALVA